MLCVVDMSHLDSIFDSRSSVLAEQRKHYMHDTTCGDMYYIIIYTYGIATSTTFKSRAKLTELS